jgi:two-component system OmpR family sensor kinase
VSVTDLTKFEKRTLVNFFLLYIGTVTVLLSFIVVLFYNTNYDNTRATLMSNMKMKAENASNEIIVSDMKGIKKDKFKFPTSEKFALQFLGANQAPAWYKKTKEAIYEDKKTNTIYYLDKNAGGHYGISYVVVKDSEFLDDSKRLGHCVVLFGSIYLGVLLVGYILARIFIEPIVEQRKQLNNFIRDTTHELNTPVSAIVLSIADDIGDISAKSLLRIKYSAKRITEIYSDLTYLFLEGTPMNNTSFIPKSDTKDMLDSQMIYLSQMAENKEQNLICHFSNSIQKISREDFLRLANNLITNAIKYTPKNGTITIALNSEKLCVEDNGVGIRKEQQEKIFERFYRASNEVGGFGIGLSIVKNIVQKYSYGIQIDSEPNVGTTVSVYFN